MNIVLKALNPFIFLANVLRSRNHNEAQQKAGVVVPFKELKYF
jgi:hypothetical protein